MDYFVFVSCGHLGSTVNTLQPAKGDQASQQTGVCFHRFPAKKMGERGAGTKPLGRLEER